MEKLILVILINLKKLQNGMKNILKVKINKEEEKEIIFGLDIHTKNHIIMKLKKI